MFPRFDDAADARADRQGHERLARRGRRQGGLRLPTAAEELAAQGEQVILVRRETNPDDLNGMIAAQGILTSRGGKTSRTPPSSRAAWARPASAAPRSSRSTSRTGAFTAPGGVGRQRGRRDLDRRHDRRGLPRRGAGRARRRSCSTSRATLGRRRRADDLVRGRAPADDPRRRRRAGSAVRANADTPEDAERARRFGAAGHRPVPHRAHVPRRPPPATSSDLILADERRASGRRRWTRCCRCSARTSSASSRAMDGLPVTIRLLDPPLHEFLPDLTELSVEVARRRGAAARTRRRRARRCSTRCAGCTSRTRCSACAACGSASSSPACSRMQVRAIAEAAAQLQGRRRRPAAVEIMVPLVGAVQELEVIREEAEQILAEVAEATGQRPRRPDRHDDRGAARRADRRPDRRGRRVLLLRHQRPDPDDLGLLPRRRRGGVLLALPRARHLRRLARSSRSTATASAGWCGSPSRRAARPGPDLKLGVCGEHGGDPDSVHFFHEVGLDYVSCSPFRVPVARLEAGRAAHRRRRAATRR